jgi:hypothetical protein
LAAEAGRSTPAAYSTRGASLRHRADSFSAFEQPAQKEVLMFYLQEGFTYRNFLMDVLAIFIFIVWFWLLITVFADLFRRHDISGWIKAIWVIGLIVFPYIAILGYLIFQGRGMAQRNVQQAQQARDELRRVVGFSVADEIQKLDALKKAGSISEAEFASLRARLVQ